MTGECVRRARRRGEGKERAAKVARTRGGQVPRGGAARGWMQPAKKVARVLCLV